MSEKDRVRFLFFCCTFINLYDLDDVIKWEQKFAQLTEMRGSLWVVFATEAML